MTHTAHIQTALATILLASGIWCNAQTMFVLPMPHASLAAPVNQDGASGVVKLGWNRSASTNVTGYRVKYGTNIGTFNNSAGVGNVTNVTIKNLVEASTYYFAAVAVDSIGIESEPSNMVTNFVQPKLTLTPHIWRASVRVPQGRTNVFPYTNGWHYKVTAIVSGIESTPALWPSNRFDRVIVQTSTNLLTWQDAFTWQTNFNKPQEYLRLRSELIRWE